MSFLDFFRNEEPDTLDEVREADEILAWAALPYYGKFLDWLEQEASRPAEISQHMEMVKQAVRSNTLREVRNRLIQRVASAESVARRVREESMRG